jgi:hypothetical protein
MHLTYFKSGATWTTRPNSPGSAGSTGAIGATGSTGATQSEIQSWHPKYKDDIRNLLLHGEHIGPVHTGSLSLIVRTEAQWPRIIETHTVSRSPILLHIFLGRTITSALAHHWISICCLLRISPYSKDIIPPLLTKLQAQQSKYFQARHIQNAMKYFRSQIRSKNNNWVAHTPHDQTDQSGSITCPVWWQLLYIRH